MSRLLDLPGQWGWYSGTARSDLANLNWAQLFNKSVDPNKILQATWNRTIDVNAVDAELKKGPLVINLTTDPYHHHEDYVVDELLKITNNFVVLTGDVGYFLTPKKHICFLPYWYLRQKLNNTPRSASSKQCAYRVSSLNGRPRYHRVENFIKLKEKSYFEQMLFSIHNVWDLRTEKRETPVEFWDSSIVEKFESIRSTLDQLSINDHSIGHPAYTDSYINYVTETSIRQGTIYPSEKTWKPIRAGQFAIWLSNPGHVKFLRSIGFDVFDDIINHSYDDENNLHLRIDMIHNTLDHIMSMDLTQIFQDTLARRQSNIDRFYSKELESLLTAQCNEYQL